MNLNEKIILSELNTVAFGRKLIIFDTIDSTNTCAKKLAADSAPHGTLILANTQSGGRGRLGKTFISPSGTGLYMSLIFRPDFEADTAQLITSCTACAVAEAIDEMCGCKTDIKWVNDIYLNGRKLSGILTESSINSVTGRINYVVIGIGVNVLSVKNVFDSVLSRTATSIEDEINRKIDRNQLCSMILNKLEKYICNIESRDFIEDYRKRELLTDNMITVNISGVTLKGRAVGIDNNANLVIELPDGNLRKIGSGEAELCRIKK